MIPGYAIKWQEAIVQPWLAMSPIRIGDVPSGLATPDQYILVEHNGKPTLRVDAYTSSHECFAFSDAIFWRGFLVIGWGDCVYLIVENTGEVIMHKLGMYFGSIYASEEFLLVASGDRLRRIRHNGDIHWMSDILGIDGVLVHEVTSGIILGDGEWDPPGGWREFRVVLESGEKAK